MFVFIGGVQPRTVKLDEPLRSCPACGLVSCRMKRTDQYFSLFFIPLFPVKRGRPFLECDNCGGIFRPDGSPLGVEFLSGSRKCPHCGRPLESRFDYCPYCGHKLK